MSSSIEEELIVLRNHLDTADTEIKALKAGNKTASARARKSLMSLKNGTHTLRKNVMTYTNGLPVVSKVKKIATPPEEPEPVEVIASDVPEEPEPVKPKLKRAPRGKKKLSI